MVKESQHHDFRQKNIDKTKFFDEIQHNNLITGKHQNVYRNLNHFENFHFFVSDVSGCNWYSRTYFKLSRRNKTF